MERIGLDVGPVLQQPVQDVDGFPDAARDEASEQGDGAVGDVVVGDAAIATVADVAGAEQIVLAELGRGCRPRSPRGRCPSAGARGSGRTGAEGRVEGLPEEIRAVGWRAQVRLCQRFRRLMATGKPLPKVNTAIARELAGFVWDIARRVPVAPAPVAQA